MYLCWQNRIRLFGFKRLQLLEMKNVTDSLLVLLWRIYLQYVLLIVCAGDNKHLFLAGADVGILSLFLGVCGFFFFFLFFCKVVLLQCERPQAAV